MPGSTTTRKPSGSAGARAFGDLLKQYRRAAGMTQEALAERAGYSTVYVSMLERGRRLPLDATIQTLAGALALDARDRAALRALAGGAGHPAGGTAGGPSAPPLVGRERERAVLERHLAGEGPPLLLMAGEPGIGKTSLLRETRALGASRGWRVLDGGCLRRGGQDPYAPLLEAIQRHLRDHDDDQLRADLRGCAWLVRLLPELADGPIEPLPAWSLPPERERRLMDEAVVRFLANVAGPAGTLLLLDDLQWAGVDALDLLALLARTSARPGDV
ncbi:MAG: AAA family ATPase, partial [Chloroflexi bacterium]|nr:AAA family ATPase [Chloroflexota bacterium]